ncbi:cell wall metabolism sensor histidine kinase WalK [Paenibacillus xylanexedens]|uniref:sensor histidine kinase n=1 Tax=Paenibacillus xylanexedens TaxID=528191 RepID=UPI0011AB126A|nr:HAMP domain-containing sensor histidine kinase [Paenibacillus xylanexedens]
MATPTSAPQPKYCYFHQLHQRFSQNSSLRSQLLTRSLFVLAALLLFIGILQFWIMESFLYRNQAKTMEEQLMSMPPVWLGVQPRNGASNLPFGGQSSSDGRGSNNRLLYIPDRSLALFDKNATYEDVFGEDGLASPRLTAAAYQDIADRLNAHEHVPYQLVKDNEGNEQLIVFASPGPRNRAAPMVQMGVATQPIHDLVMRQLLIFVGLSLLAMITGLILYAKVLRRTLHPLSNIVETVQRVDAGSLGERLPVIQGQQEIDQLAFSFNGMLERLEDSFEAERESKQQMQRFLSDASHELRTPLTSIHGFIEVLQRGAATNREQLNSALSSMYGESVRINKLVEDLLLLTKLDQAPERIQEVIALDGLLYEMQPQLVMMAQDRKVHLELTAKLYIVGDPHKLKQVILNLFQNAVQHTDPQHGFITITCFANEDVAELTMKDNGTGIEPEHIDHIFERFYRTSSSRSRKEGGAGLGLAITRSIVESHGGNINVYSQVSVGTSFIITLPLWKESKPTAVSKS